MAVQARPDLVAIKPLIARIGATAVGSQAAEVNALPVLVAREQQCRAERGRIPNLVAVNWADVGALQQVVDDLNGV